MPSKSREQLETGSISLAAAVITSGGKLQSARKDPQGQTLFVVTGPGVQQKAQAYLAGHLSGSLAGFNGAMNLLRDLAKGRRTLEEIGDATCRR